MARVELISIHAASEVSKHHPSDLKMLGRFGYSEADEIELGSRPATSKHFIPHRNSLKMFSLGLTRRTESFMRPIHSLFREPPAAPPKIRSPPEPRQHNVFYISFRFQAAPAANLDADDPLDADDSDEEDEDDDDTQELMAELARIKVKEG